MQIDSVDAPSSWRRLADSVLAAAIVLIGLTSLLQQQHWPAS
jgi:hypothetical protein